VEGGEREGETEREKERNGREREGERRGKKQRAKLQIRNQTSPEFICTYQSFETEKEGAGGGREAGRKRRRKKKKNTREKSKAGFAALRLFRSPLLSLFSFFSLSLLIRVSVYS
jgi:hypothetical protein